MAANHRFRYVASLVQGARRFSKLYYKKNEMGTRVVTLGLDVEAGCDLGDPDN